MTRVDFRVVRALVKRDLRMYFTRPTGYVFITLFIFLSAAAAFWQDRFFLDNLANLDQLNQVLPFLLVLFVPALTMGVWSEERRQGTDELLLTLPATDLEVVLGKYLATLGVYIASLVLSLSHVLVLSWLGSPDLGLMFGNYLGYALAGAALVAVGMLASLLTANTTIAFIVGALFCAAVGFLGVMAGVFSEGLARTLGAVSVVQQFGDFARGVVSLKAVFYFLSLAGFFVYLNVLLVGRRHWPREADGVKMGVHHAVRAAAIALALLSLNIVVSRASARLDVTAEKLHSLTDETRRLVSEIDPGRPVFIHAFVSPEVPEGYVQTRTNLLGLLREIDAVGGPRVELLVEDTEPYSEAARIARETFGITARQVPDLASARAGFSDVFLGVAVTCGASEQVIPFLDRGLPVEYELTRSIRVVANTKRKKIGVVNNDLRLFGGLDFQSLRSTPPWSVVEELKKQYEVTQVAATSPIPGDLDALVAVMPSLLPQDEMDNVAAFIESGKPALLIDDPLPIVNLSFAPSERAGANRNPFLQQGQPPPEPKGDIEGLLARFGLRWNKGKVLWDAYNPHPDLAHLPREVVFVGAGGGAERPFHPDQRMTSELQEVVFLYPGHVEKAVDSRIDFVPLLTAGKVAGEHEYATVVQRSFFGATINPRLRHDPKGSEQVIAAMVRPPATGAAAKPAEGEEKEEGGGGEGAKDEGEKKKEAAAEATETAKPKGPNLIFVADADFISEQFFAIRRMAPGTLNFDNVTFFLNAIDTLVGDESFVELRNRRVAHRTLDRVEKQTREFIERRAAEEKEAEDGAEKALAEAQKSLNEKVQAVQARTDLDAQTKQIMARNLEEVENRRLEVLKSNIETEKEAKIQRSRERMEAQVRKIQSGIRTSAVLLPPLPVLALGVLIFIRREKREREGAAAARRLRA